MDFNFFTVLGADFADIGEGFPVIGIERVDIGVSKQFGERVSKAFFLFRSELAPFRSDSTGRKLFKVKEADQLFFDFFQYVRSCLRILKFFLQKEIENSCAAVFNTLFRCSRVGKGGADGN